MRKSYTFVIGIVLFLFYFLSSLYFLPYGISLLGEGYYVYGAEQIMKGKVLYRDIAIFGHAPGQFYALGFFMKLFGFNLFSERLYYIIMAALTASAVFLISSRIIKNKFFSLLPALLFILLIQHKTDRLLFPLLTLLIVIIYDQTNPAFKSNKFPFLIGLLTGLSIIFSQEMGAVLAFCLIVFFFWKISFEKKKGFTNIDSRDIFFNILLGIAGLVVVLSPVFFYFVVNNSFDQMVYYLFYFPFKVYAKAQVLPFPNIVSNLLLVFKQPSIRSLYYLSTALFYYFGVSLYFLSALFFIKKSLKNYNRTDSYVLLLVFGLFSSINGFVHADIPALTLGMAPILILVFFMFDFFYTRPKSKYPDNQKLGGRTKNKVLLLGVIIIFLLLSIYGQLVINPTTYAEESNLLILKNKNTYQQLNAEKGKGILIKSDLARDKDINNVVGFIMDNTAKGDKIFVVPYESMFYFLAERDNPTRYNQFIPGQQGNQAELESIDLIEKAKTKFVIYGHGWDVNNISFASSSPLIHSYIKEKWVLNKTFGIYEIYSPKQQSLI